MKTIPYYFDYVVLIALIFSITFNREKTDNKRTVDSLEHVISSCDSDNSLTILTYNVWGLPVSLKGHDQKNRFQKLPNAVLASNHEIICLQEVFNTNLQRSFLENNTSFFLGSDYSCTSKHVFGLVHKDCYGGLMTLSKFPIIEETFHPFDSKKYSIIEKVGSKGFLATKIIREGQVILVINTHLYAGQKKDDALKRKKQVEYMIDIIKRDYDNLPIILSGDLNFINNVDEATYENLVSSLHLIDSGEELNLPTANGTNSKYTTNNDKEARLDFILLSENNHHSIREPLVKFSEQDQLSDHFAWSVSIDMY